jgi:hypothetical protein
LEASEFGDFLGSVRGRGLSAGIYHEPKPKLEDCSFTSWNEMSVNSDDLIE